MTPLRDLLIGSVGLGFGIFGAYQSSLLRVWLPSQGGPGEGLYPLAVSGIISAAAMTIIVKAVVAGRGSWSDHLHRAEAWIRTGGVTKVRIPNAGRLAAITGALIGFAWLAEPLGFFAAQFLFLAFLVCVVERRSILVGTVASAAITVAFYMVFEVGLGVPFPDLFFAS